MCVCACVCVCVCVCVFGLRDCDVLQLGKLWTTLLTSLELSPVAMVKKAKKSMDSAKALVKVAVRGHTDGRVCVC